MFIYNYNVIKIAYYTFIYVKYNIQICIYIYIIMYVLYALVSKRNMLSRFISFTRIAWHSHFHFILFFPLFVVVVAHVIPFPNSQWGHRVASPCRAFWNLLQNYGQFSVVDAIGELLISVALVLHICVSPRWQGNFVGAKNCAENKYLFRKSEVCTKTYLERQINGMTLVVCRAHMLVWLAAFMYN